MRTNGLNPISDSSLAMLITVGPTGQRAHQLLSRKVGAFPLPPRRYPGCFGAYQPRAFQRARSGFGITLSDVYYGRYQLASLRAQCRRSKAGPTPTAARLPVFGCVRIWPSESRVRRGLLSVVYYCSTYSSTRCWSYCRAGSAAATVWVQSTSRIRVRSHSPP